MNFVRGVQWHGMTHAHIACGDKQQLNVINDHTPLRKNPCIMLAWWQGSWTTWYATN